MGKFKKVLAALQYQDPFNAAATASSPSPSSSSAAAAAASDSELASFLAPARCEAFFKACADYIKEQPQVAEKGGGDVNKLNRHTIMALVARPGGEPPAAFEDWPAVVQMWKKEEEALAVLLVLLILFFAVGPGPMLEADGKTLCATGTLIISMLGPLLQELANRLQQTIVLPIVDPIGLFDRHDRGEKQPFPPGWDACLAHWAEWVLAMVAAFTVHSHQSSKALLALCPQLKAALEEVPVREAVDVDSAGDGTHETHMRVFVGKAGTRFAGLRLHLNHHIPLDLVKERSIPPEADAGLGPCVRKVWLRPRGGRTNHRGPEAVTPADAGAGAAAPAVVRGGGRGCR